MCSQCTRARVGAYLALVVVGTGEGLQHLRQEPVHELGGLVSGGQEDLGGHHAVKVACMQPSRLEICAQGSHKEKGKERKGKEGKGKERKARASTLGLP